MRSWLLTIHLVGISLFAMFEVIRPGFVTAAVSFGWVVAVSVGLTMLSYWLADRAGSSQ